jgi:hypothetical protein
MTTLPPEPDAMRDALAAIETISTGEREGRGYRRAPRISINSSTIPNLPKDMHRAGRWSTRAAR